MLSNQARIHLHTILVGHYSFEELRTLCAELGIDAETVVSTDKLVFARELVKHLERRNALTILLNRLCATRPNLIEQINQLSADLDSGVDDSTESQLERNLVVISSEKQIMELRVSPAGLELYLHDVRPRRRKGLMWTLPADVLKTILANGKINVRPFSDTPGYGQFDIGEKQKWHYSLGLFPEPMQLHNEIRRLIEVAQRRTHIPQTGPVN